MTLFTHMAQCIQ